MAYLQQPRDKLTITNVLILINSLIIMAGAFMTPLWSNFVLQIGGNLQTAGIAIAIFSIVIGGFMCLAGKIEHHYQHDEWFMISSQCVVLLSYIGYFFVHHPWQLYLVEMGLGIGGAFQSPAICAIYQRYFTQKQSALFWAVWNGFYNIAMGSGALLAAVLVSYFNYKTMFAVLTGVAALCLFVTIGLMMKIQGKNFMASLRLTKNETESSNCHDHA